MIDIHDDKKTLLVTGAAGFVGPHLIEVLEDVYKIIAADCRSHNPFNDRPEVNYEQLDVTDKEAVFTLVIKYMPDAIIHLAAETNNWFGSPYSVLAVNLLGTANLYEAVYAQKKLSGYSPKIIYAGSSETYGQAAGPAPITEDTRLAPINHYSVSKASADLLSYDYVRSNKLNIVIVRPFTHTGPGQRVGFFVPDMVSQVVQAELGGERRILVGNLDSVRDYSDVRDVVQAYRLLLQEPITAGEAYNICSGEGVKIKDLLEMIVSRSKVRLTIEPDNKRIRPSDTPIFVGDNTKLKKATGWQPSYTLENTIDDTFEFWRSQSHIKIEAN